MEWTPEYIKQEIFISRDECDNFYVGYVTPQKYIDAISEITRLQSELTALMQKLEKEGE